MIYKTNKNDMGVNDEVRRLSTWFPTDGQERVLTGWSSLDEKLGGLRNGELMVVSGYSNMGKTTFVTNLIKNISVEQSLPILFFSFQLPEYMVSKSLLSSMSGLNLYTQLTEEEKSLLRIQIKRLEQAPICLCNEEMNADLLGSTAEKFAQANGIKAIFIDGLRNIFCPQFDTSAIEETLQILKTTAIKLNVPIVITDTCKVAGYKNDFSSLPYYPNFDHTSYDPVFNACDVMLVLHRPEMFGVTVDVQGRDLRNVLTVGLEKNCQGTKGMVPLKCDFAVKTIEEEMKSDFAL